MQNYCKTIGALAAASALVAGTAMAEVEYEIAGGYTSQYLFRGTEYGNDLTEVGVKAKTQYQGLDLTVAAWNGTYELQNASNTDVAETDLSFEAAKDLGFATAAVGYIWYTFDSELDDRQEAYVGLSKDLGFATAALAYYWDVEGDNEGYTELSLSRSFELSTCLDLVVKTALGYTLEHDEFANWVTGAQLDYGFSDTATLSPFVFVAVDGSENDTYESDSEVELVGGAKLTVTF